MADGPEPQVPCEFALGHRSFPVAGPADPGAPASPRPPGHHGAGSWAYKGGTAQLRLLQPLVVPWVSEKVAEAKERVSPGTEPASTESSGPPASRTVRN